jgi:hypothetical protein
MTKDIDITEFLTHFVVNYKKDTKYMVYLLVYGGGKLYINNDLTFTYENPNKLSLIGVINIFEEIIECDCENLLDILYIKEVNNEKA